MVGNSQTMDRAMSEVFGSAVGRRSRRKRSVRV